ncbi:MAG: HYR domain-containing protein [Chloroflexota bacterium]|nr:MAG: HYR domain-containing protein [Chloroflexota bacterium]
MIGGFERGDLGMTPTARLRKLVPVVGWLSMLVLVLAATILLASSTAEASASVSKAQGRSSGATDGDTVVCTTSWINASGGSWLTGSNWSTGLVPGTSDDVCIIQDGTYTVTAYGAAVTVKSLTIGGATGTQRLKIGSTGAAHAYLTTTGGMSVGSQGEVELTNSDGAGNNAWLAGPVNNAGTILSSAGAGGTRFLQGNLTNSGALLIDQFTNFNGNGTVLQNFGTVTVGDGVGLNMQNGASFTNAGGVIGATTPTGSGYVYQIGGTFTQGEGTTTGAKPVYVDNATLSYTGSGASSITLRQTSTLTGNIAAGQTLSIESISTATASVTAASSFTNAGTIVFTNGDSCGCTIMFTVSSGTMTNTGTIRSELAHGGGRYLRGSVTNNGSFIVNQTTNFDWNGKLFQNGGTVAIADGMGLLVLGGASFTNAGGSVGATSAGGSGLIYEAGGTFTQGEGTTTGTKPVYVDNATLSYTGSGASNITLRQTSTLTGSIAAGQTLSIESLCSINATVTAGASFTNAGTITLTDGDSCGNTIGLIVSSGTMTNTGTLRIERANGGGRYLQSNLTNSGSLLVNTNTSFSLAGMTLLNSGTIAIADGFYLSLASGASLTNAGGVVGATTSTGTGYLYQSGGTLTQGDGTTTGTNPIYLANGALRYTGSGASKIALRGTSTLSGSMATGQTLRIESVYNLNTEITAAVGFTNRGTIVLTNGDGNGYGVTLVVSSGVLTNIGTIQTVPAAGGARVIQGDLANSGTLQLDALTTLQGNLTNSGSLLINANTSYNKAGTALLNSGTVAIADGVNLSIAGGASLTNAGGVVGATTSTGSGYLYQTAGTFTQGDGTTVGTKPVYVVNGALRYTGSGASSIALRGTSTLSGATAAGQTLRIESAYGLSSNVTVDAGFTNAGTIVLTDGDSYGYSVTLVASSGMLTNSGVLQTLPGVGGGRVIQGSVINNGSLLIDANTSYNLAGTTLTNSGAVAIADGIVLSLSGGASFVNAGGSTGATSPTGTGQLNQTGGAFTQGDGTIPGTKPVILRAVALSYTGGGASSIALRGASTLSGNLTADQTLVLESLYLGGGYNLTADVTAVASFTNAGTIVLTNGDAYDYSAYLTLSSGTLTNTGTIRTLPGAGGARKLVANIINTGILRFDAATTFQGNLTNTGNVLVNANTSYLGANTLLNQGTISMADGVALTAPNAPSITNDADGSIVASGSLGNGYLFQTGGSFAQGAGTTSGVRPVILQDLTLNYTGSGESTLALRGASTLQGQNFPGQTLRLESSCTRYDAIVGAPASYNNAGVIVLTNGDSCPYGIMFGTADGFLTNTGTIRTLTAVGGYRYITSNLINSGTVFADTGSRLEVGSYYPTSAGALQSHVLSGTNYGILWAWSGGTLAGTLEPVLAPGYAPADGTSFSFVMDASTNPSDPSRASSTEGRFDTVESGTLGDSGLYFVPKYSRRFGFSAHVQRPTVTPSSPTGVRGASLTLTGTGWPAPDEIGWPPMDTSVLLSFTDHDGAKTLYPVVWTENRWGDGQFSTSVTIPLTVTLGTGTFTAMNSMIGATVTATLEVGLPLDSTPPVVTPIVTGTLGSSGWYTSSVSIAWTVADPESGIVSSSSCDTVTLSTDTAGTVVSCSALNAADLSTTGSVTIMIDTTAPVLSLPADMTVLANTTAGALVSYSASAIDTLSGVSAFACDPPSGSTFPVGTTLVSCSATDTAGNTAAGSFQITVLPRPDLTVADVTAPDTGSAGQALNVSWTAANQGTADAAPFWQDRIFLSTDDIWDSGDTFLASVTRGLTLTVGGSYSVTQSVTVPKVTGSYYLIVKTDMYNAVKESDETNNTRPRPILVQTPDLAPTAFSGPSTAMPGQTVPLTWTVTNQGNTDAVPSWQDRVYLSTDTRWDGGDAFLATVTQSVTLTAGGSYTLTQSAVLPKLAAGSYFLIFRTDHFNVVKELNENNNSAVVPLILVTKPDLDVTSQSTPSTAMPGQTVPISWTVRNQGNGDAAPSWQDRVYLSMDGVGNDYYLTSTTQSLTVTSGSGYTVSQNVVLPKTAAGSYFLIFRTDMYNAVKELDENNNALVVPLTLYARPELVPTALMGPGTAEPGQAISVTWTVKNQGNGDAAPSWQDRVYLSTDGTYDSGDTFLVNATQGVTLAVGSSYSVTRSVTLPNLTGSYYLLLRTDVYNAVKEQDETNNVRAVPITLQAVQAPDLTPTALAAPSTASPGQTVPITWTVRNQGDSDASPSWQDRVYLSTNGIWDSGDTYVTLVTRAVAVIADDSYTVTADVRLPNVAVGSYFLIMRTDMFNAVTESDETNNTAVVPITLQP